jgi:hypothetical protein
VHEPVEREVSFAEGNVSAVVRVGDTVRRGTGHWTPTVHALLRHLEQVGFAGAPRVLGIDELGREILSFVPGITIPPPLTGFRSDEIVIETARLLRRYHDATTSFVPPPDARWWLQVGGPREGEVICHNDIAPWNTVVVDGRPTAFVDWDFAAPGPRLWDVAHAIWRCVPLYGNDEDGPLVKQVRRIALFCDAYGLTDRRGLLDTVRRRQTVLYDSVRTWAAEGVPAFARMWQEGHADGVLRDRAWLDRHRAKLEWHLSRPERRWTSWLRW